MGAVQIVLEESLLLTEDESGGNPSLRSGAEALLRRLRHSQLRVALCHQEDISNQKAVFLTRIAALHSLDCISLCASHANNSHKEILGWAGDGGICFYATSNIDESLFSNLQNHNLCIISVGTCIDVKINKDILFISKLEELLTTICRCIKKEMAHSTPVLLVGYVMKPSREEDFAKRGAFPLYPTQNGLMFVPLTFDIPLASQLQEVDIILHKVTDEITSVDLFPCADFSEGISLSVGMCELERFVHEHTDVCVVDPFNNIYPLLDRHQIQQILLELQDIGMEGCYKLRAPHCLKVDNFHDADLPKQLAGADLPFPIIVKPQVACGVADAHNMALVFKFEGLVDVNVPLPAILQEYVDHGSRIFKVYVLGDKIFHAVKKSMPNASALLLSAEKTGLTHISFNSLKPLPVAIENLPIGDEQLLDNKLVGSAAEWLRKRLNLTVFGFDVVIQEGSGDHCIVDLNYLPSFKEVPDCDAIPAFWDAIKSTYEHRKPSSSST